MVKDPKKFLEVKEQVETLKQEYYARTTGSNWLKDSPMYQQMLAEMGEESGEDEDDLNDR